MSEPRISIVLPVYNQADHIGDVIRNYEQALARVPYSHELILVVNGSRDASLKVCQSLAEEFAALRVQHSERGGWGLAVRLGLSVARGDVLCYTNSARTSAQDLVLILLYGVVNPGVVVKANRKIRENWRRRMGSLLYNLECRALFDLSYWDINGTPKVFPRQFDKLLALTRDDDLIDAEFNIICRREGYPVLEVPIFASRRHGGEATTSYRSAVKLYWGAYQLWRHTQEHGRREPRLPMS
jgi:glycosyltransferase involved in cell wall biosynthesis